MRPRPTRIDLETALESGTLGAVPIRPERSAVVGLAAMLACVLGACGAEPEAALGRMPNDRGRPVAEPALDAGIPFDFRWVRIADEPHIGQTRQCDVVFVGTVEQVERRIERRYVGREVAQRVSVRCGAAAGETWLDLVFPPAAIGFASTIRVGQRLLVEVIAADGGFEDATVAEFRAVMGGSGLATASVDEPLSIGAGFDFDQVDVHPELVGRVEPCSVVWVGPIRRIARELRDRYPRGATHVLPLACHATRGDSPVDVVATPRTAPDFLAIRRGSRVRLRIVAARAGADDEPVTRLVR